MAKTDRVHHGNEVIIVYTGHSQGRGVNYKASGEKGRNFLHLFDRRVMRCSFILACGRPGCREPVAGTVLRTLLSLSPVESGRENNSFCSVSPQLAILPQKVAMKTLIGGINFTFVVANPPRERQNQLCDARSQPSRFY